MTTLARILQIIENLERDTFICFGLSKRLLAGYQSKECKESYQNAEKWRRKDYEELTQYPPEWIIAAYTIRDLRKSISSNSLL